MKIRFLKTVALLICLPTGAVAGETNKADLVFFGTVQKLEAAPLPPPSLENWVVEFKVDRVLSGSFTNATFSFRIHSPSRSGLEVGKQYQVEARRSGNSYVVDPEQWVKRNSARDPDASRPPPPKQDK
jgi:hypothetical protein